MWGSGSRAEGVNISGKVMRSGKSPFKGRQFTAEVILWAVRGYLQFPISYRDLDARGQTIDFLLSAKRDAVAAALRPCRQILQQNP